jgi:hypothetical protein
MKRSSLISLFIFFATLSLAQQRIGFDLNTSGSNLYANLSYQRVFAKNFIVQSGLFGGFLAFSEEIHDRNEIQNGLVVTSPFESVNENRSRDNNAYELQSYILRGRGIGIHAGLGTFHEFSTKHGLKFFLNGRLGYSWTETHSKHFNPLDNYGIEEFTTTGHLYTALSPELYHTIRLGGRYTLLYGVKLPYYFLIDRSTYAPVNIKNIYYGLEPEFSLGLTYVVGKCDE